MDHRTEAACLLEQGALYRKRIGLEPVVGDGDPIFAGFKHGAFSLYFGDAPIYHFDLEGRWQRAFVEGIHYLKGLDADVHAIDRVREGPNLVLQRRTLSFGEAGDLDARIRSVALELMAGLDDGRFRRLEPPAGKAQPLSNDELREFLERISRWDAAAWFAHRERYTGTYGPLPFLPPECQNAVVLQATLGHAEGRTFGLSPAAEPYVRSADEFAQHARDVAGLWGRRLLQSRAHLPGGRRRAASAGRTDRGLPRPSRQDVSRSGSADDGGRHPLRGRPAFLDDFRGPRFDRDGWRRFAERGLIRVSLGVESGDPDGPGDLRQGLGRRRSCERPSPISRRRDSASAS